MSEEGVPRDRLVVIPNFVDRAAFDGAAAERRRHWRQAFGILGDEVVVGVVANLYPVKNHAMLLRAAARIASTWPAVRYVLAGDGGERAALEAQARQLGLEQRIILPGRVSPEPGLARAFDIAVLTSWEEGFPNWLVEAMAAGLPVVATRVGGVPDAVVDGETGFLVPPDDDERLAAGLVRLLEDRTLAAHMGSAGRERARRLYHEDTVLRSLESLYESLARD
jgi:glycosyltransferase involved in cell wall biosynthesis